MINKKPTKYINNGGLRAFKRMLARRIEKNKADRRVYASCPKCGLQFIGKVRCQCKVQVKRKENN